MEEQRKFMESDTDQKVQIVAEKSAATVSNMQKNSFPFTTTKIIDPRSSFVTCLFTVSVFCLGF